MLAAIGRRLRREPDDVALILPFEEVVDALGRVGESDAGLQTVPLDAIVGSVDRTARLRPRASAPPRSRHARALGADRRRPPARRVAAADLALPRSATCYFVRDGHHRVSVARAMGDTVIDAYVTDVRDAPARCRATTRVPDLPLKGHERLFRERVPLSAEQRGRIALTDPWDFGVLAEAIEAWGFRAMQERHEYLDRREVGAPVVRGGVRAGGRDAASTAVSSSATRRPPTPTCAWPGRATACCARTSGATRCSPACAATPRRRRRTRTPRRRRRIR